MKRRTNIISNILYLLLTMGALFGALVVCNNRYQEELFPIIVKFVVGALVAGLLNTCAHELGHFILGKKNGFVFSSMSIWFFKWTRVGKRIRFDWTMMGEEAGYTEMIPATSENMESRLKNMTRGGIISSFIMMLIGIPPLFIISLPVWVYCLWVAFLPVGAYFFFGTAFPMSNSGVLNDGAVLCAIKNKWDTMSVVIALLKIQSEMYNGKTPSGIDEGVYFDLPQLPEDDLNFALLLDARYNYYLDKEDFSKAKECSDRLNSILDYLPKSYACQVKTLELYNSCTFDYDEERADDVMYELEKYLNRVNTMTTVRAKLAYLLFIKKEKDCFDIFYNKGIKEANRCQIKGLASFERKLFEKLKCEYEKM